jgi:hypothetical protein
MMVAGTKCRSAFSHEENSPAPKVTSARLNVSRLKLAPNAPFNRNIGISGTENWSVPYTVPEGQADRSLARSAWNLEKRPSKEPSRALARRIRERAIDRAKFRLSSPFGTDNDFSSSAVPPGRGLSPSLPRHFVPGYDQPVPPGQKPFAHKGLTLS